jgi:lipoprotein
MKFFFICIFFHLLLSCENEKIKDNVGNLISYRDSVFLEIEGNLNYPDTIWRAKDTWIKALERLERHLKVENNLLTWNVKEGHQINMGENVFHFIIEMWERDNAKVRTGRYKLKHVGGNRYVAVPIVEGMKSECEE